MPMARQGGTENAEKRKRVGKCASARVRELQERVLATENIGRPSRLSACLCDARTQTGVSTRTGRQPKELNACLRATHRQAKDEKTQRRVLASRLDGVTQASSLQVKTPTTWLVAKLKRGWSLRQQRSGLRCATLKSANQYCITSCFFL